MWMKCLFPEQSYVSDYLSIYSRYCVYVWLELVVHVAGVVMNEDIWNFITDPVVALEDR